MSTWDAILSNTTMGAGFTGSAASRIFDLINSGQNSKVASVAKVRDINTNGFLSHESNFKPKYFIRAFDEPTYLTFRIEFCFNNPRNALYNNELIKDSIGIDNLYNGDTVFDYLPEAFLQDGMLAQVDNAATSLDLKYDPWKDASTTPGRSSVSYFYSAEDYLAYSLGEFGRARLMRKIKQVLKDLQDNFPYYFRSIEGLNTLNKIDPKTGKRVDKGEIVIKCYEGMDLKITQLIQMVRKVMWDDIYQRWVLPDMMRYFSMKIYVSEIRMFHEAHSAMFEGSLFDTSPKLNMYDFNMDAEARNATVFPPDGGDLYSKIMKMTGGILTAAQALGSTFFEDSWLNNAITQAGNAYSTYSDITLSLTSAYQLMCVSAINNIMPTICFELHMCEFNVEESFSEMNTLKSTSDDPQEQQIRIKVGQIEDYQVYPLDRNLKMNSDNTSYLIDTRIYGYVDEKYEKENPHAADADMYEMREDGFSGTTAFADRVFTKDFNKDLRQAYEKADNENMGVLQDKVYRHLSNLYDGALKSYFANMAIQINDPAVSTPISPRSKMYSEDVGRKALYSADGALRYKKNSLSMYTGIMSLLYSGMNAVGMFVDNPFSTFSKATSVTHEDLETQLPEVYAAALALRSTFKKMHDNNFDDESLLMANTLNTFAFSKATQNSAVGAVAQHIYGGLFGRGNTGGGNGDDALGNMYTDNVSTVSAAIQDAQNFVNTQGIPANSYPDAVGNFSTIAQDHDHQRHNFNYP